MNEKLLASIRFYFAQSVFNTNCHFKAYNRLVKNKKRISNFVKFIAAGTLLLLILQIIGLEHHCQSLLNILAFIGILFTGVSLVFEIFNKEDVSPQIFQQKMYAEKYKSLRDEYMGLIEEIMSNSLSEELLRIKRDNLQKRYSAFGENAPQTIKEDYKQTQLGLGLEGSNGEEFTWSDKEIDKFLPDQLRLNKQN
jgi:cell division protein FtsL